ncbi:hypothetical protein [Dysgonomonas sp. 520]|uniref:hypothetical protein n=1 Tax=Dysgonomonas sp. 520 TaxID=2302931 RepID=UPI0013D0A6E8|nr:hypothetical protein [Dysgonomonas sp. 520]NDW08061.1 hypothetical protein [Dysgonomonas sp. 520]
MSVYNYPKFKILIDPKSKKTQGLCVGDVVRRQYFDNPNLIYSLMIVTDTGTELVGEGESAYFIGALIEGDEPKTGEILDFVRITNLFDTNRSGALYLTASDCESPFMDVIDGLAIENSLCFPYLYKGKQDIPDKNKYACVGEKYLDVSYIQSGSEANRIFRITRNTVNNTIDKIGFKQSIGKRLEHPQRLIISYKVRASKSLTNVPVSFGYTSGLEMDGTDIIEIKADWEYKLHLVTIDYPASYQRSFFIDLTNFLKTEGDWCEIAELNIVLQSDISTFAGATKTRIGKVKGIVDPVFGVLDGYGAYFQNLYATKNVNIAGTLTAGDENGFSSTFYVGKIHKNIIQNSIDCSFEDIFTVEIENETPVGIGSVWQMGYYAKLIVQSHEWRTAHIDKKYCFSFWTKANNDVVLSLYQDEYYLQDIIITASNEWRRHYLSFPIQKSEALNLIIRIDATKAGVLISAPQMESGITPSQYQPTDGTLSYVEDYGAWFSKGGIGGTIQNPLLKLNADGSISSRDNSFVINPDGTGHFASGRFNWTKDTITLQDVTIRWEDLNKEAQEKLKPIVVEIVSNRGFIIKNGNNNVDATAKLYRDGKELDTEGVFYTYTWSLWNRTGTVVIKTYTGKSIIVDKNDVTGSGVLTCEVLV